MTIVVDASVLVAALVDSGSDGRWAQKMIASDDVAAPHLVLVETANVLRRAAAVGDISDDIATIAHHDLLDLSVELYPYELLAPRIWELRANVTAYDAWYVALAEALDAPLATIDRRLTRASGPQCAFVSTDA